VGSFINFVKDYISPHINLVTTDVVTNVVTNVAKDVATGVYIRPKSSSIIELLLRINLTVFLR